MNVSVITPPQAIITPADAKLLAPVLAQDEDVRVAALIAVSQAAIEPPHGWVGRAFGVQTLETALNGFHAPCFFLPAPPLRSVVSVKYFDADGAEQTLPADAYRVYGIGAGAGSIAVRGNTSWPVGYCEPESVRVRFEAGYDADDPQLAPARHAVVLAATHLRSLSSQDLALRSEEVEGVGITTWTVSDAAEKLIRSAVESLLSPYRVWAV